MGRAGRAGESDGRASGSGGRVGWPVGWAGRSDVYVWRAGQAGGSGDRASLAGGRGRADRMGVSGRNAEKEKRMHKVMQVRLLRRTGHLLKLGRFPFSKCTSYFRNYFALSDPVACFSCPQSLGARRGYGKGLPAGRRTRGCGGRGRKHMCCAFPTRVQAVIDAEGDRISP